MTCVTMNRGFNGPAIVLGILHMLFSNLQNMSVKYYLYFTNEEIETQKG